MTPVRDEPIVSVRGLTKRFGETVAVRDLDLDVEYGEIVGIIGPSGCGKTTTVRMMTGSQEPTAGTVQLWGQNLSDLKPNQRVRVGYLPQLPALLPDLSIKENIHFQASLVGVGFSRAKQMKELLRLVGLSDDGGTKIKNASGGMRRRAALVAALFHDPSLIFLDEPTAGIDPVLRQELWQHFGALREDGKTLVITTQYIGEAIYCDRVAVIHEGTIIAFDSPKGLRHDVYGGDVVLIEFDGLVPFGAIPQLAQLPFVRKDPTTPAPDKIEIVVDDAGAAIAAITALLADAGHEVAAIEEKIIDFDQMFVDLIEQATVKDSEPVPEAPDTEARTGEATE